MDYDELFFPINIEKQHWLLLVVELDTQTFSYYDSMKSQIETLQDDITAPFKKYLGYR
jgi:Ulp1 family protease